MPVVAVLNQKGGVGKTTLSTNIAAYFAQQGSKVFFVDADIQRSALSWSEARETSPLFHMVGIPQKTLHRDLREISAGYGWTIIDGPPASSEVARSAIAAADLVVIPVTPSPYDVWASAATFNLVNEVLGIRPNFKAGVVINRQITNTAIGRDVKDALAEYNIPIFQTVIRQRVVFAESAQGGLTVLETDPEGKAASEIRELCAEIEEQLK